MQPAGRRGVRGGTCKDSGFNFVCHGGRMDGQRCDPRVADVCGDGGECYAARRSRRSPASAYGPPDYGSGGGGATGAGIGQRARRSAARSSPSSEHVLRPASTAIYPIEGVLVWNSHAFNLYDTADHQRAVVQRVLRAAGGSALPRPRRSSTRPTSSSRTCRRSTSGEYCRTVHVPAGDAHLRAELAHPQARAALPHLGSGHRQPRAAAPRRTPARARPNRRADLGHDRVQRPGAGAHSNDAVVARQPDPAAAPVQVLLDLRQRARRSRPR